MRVLALLFVMLPLPGLVQAQGLELPANATRTAELAAGMDSYAVPIGPARGGEVPMRRVEGDLSLQAWKIDEPGLTTLQLMAPLRAQLEAAGYTVLLDCEGEGCGGFDFRLGLRLLPAPDFWLDLSDFRALSAANGGSAVFVIASRTAGATWLHIARIGASPPPQANAAQPALRAATAGTVATQPGDLGGALEAAGHVVLADLSFETGSAQLGPGPFASLDALAGYLKEHPDRTVALVGHTDSEGSLDVNIALSKRRAGSVLERLVSDYGVPRRQLAAEGMGYLAPMATNLTAEGREANRRVEVILISTR